MSKYPAEIDSDKELPSALDGATENTSESINALKDAVLSVEKTMGVSPQGSMPTLNERINVSLNANGTDDVISPRSFTSAIDKLDILPFCR